MKIENLVINNIYKIYKNKFEVIKVIIKLVLTLKVQVAEMQQQANTPVVKPFFLNIIIFSNLANIYYYIIWQIYTTILINISF